MPFHQDDQRYVANNERKDDEMKYRLLENLVLSIEPETPEDQALINHLNTLHVVKNGCCIEFAGFSWSEGRRMSMSIRFEKPEKAKSEPTKEQGPNSDQATMLSTADVHCLIKEEIKKFSDGLIDQVRKGVIRT